jgi:hypothetical protein
MIKNNIRWILFFPIALICSILTLLISGSVFRLALLNIFDEPIWRDSDFWAQAERFFAQFTAAFVFVWSGAICAPINRYRISIVLCSILIVFVIAGAFILGLFYKIPDNVVITPNYTLKIASILASIFAVYIVKKYVRQERESNI